MREGGEGRRWGRSHGGRAHFNPVGLSVTVVLPLLRLFGEEQHKVDIDDSSGRPGAGGAICSVDDDGWRGVIGSAHTSRLPALLKIFLDTHRCARAHTLGHALRKTIRTQPCRTRKDACRITRPGCLSLFVG